MLLLCVGLMFAQNGLIPGRDGNQISGDPLTKLSGVLRDVVLVYRGAPRLTRENYAAQCLNRINAARVQAGLPALSVKSDAQRIPQQLRKPLKDSGMVDGIYRPQGISGSIVIDSLISETVQKRWGNPAYDVLVCHILLEGSEKPLEIFNLKVRSRSRGKEGTVVQVEIAGNSIEKVATLDNVVRISPVLSKSINNETTTRLSGVQRIRLGRPGNYTKGYTGKGTIVGVIDTGIDWSHEDFIDPRTGSTRVHILWDTGAPTLPGRTPADLFPDSPRLSGLTYGRVWTKAQIDAGTCTAIDTAGHGTHVSGTAAGNGSATGRYTGMAPNAEIVFVKGLDNNGILFIYEMARLEGKPCAVNMSYGPMFPFIYMNLSPEDYPADGTSLDAMQIRNWNAAYGGGHVPVKSAGNHGHWNTYTDLSHGVYPYKTGGYHAGCDLTHSGEFHLEIPNFSQVWINFPWDAVTHPYVNISLWYGRDISLSFETPGGEVLGPVSHGSWGYLTSASEGLVYYELDRPVQPNGEYTGRIIFEDLLGLNGYVPAAGQWKIHVTPATPGPGRVDMWVWEWILDRGYYDYFVWDLYNSDTVFSGSDAHQRYIFDEGASPYEISVGNYVGSDNWDPLTGGSFTYVKQPWMGRIADSSAPGPSRDGRVKPDVAAPGTIVRSAASRDAGWLDSQLVDSGHGVMSGTSMSAPAVTGATALMLQKYPQYSVARVRKALRLNSRIDADTRTEGPNAYGFGKLWMKWLNDPPVARVSASPLEVILDDPERTITFSAADSYDPEGFPLTYTFSAESEGAVTYDFTTDGSTATLEPDPDNEGRYRVSLTVNDTLTDSETVYSSWVTAKFYPVLPPVNASVERLTNDYIFYKEYINRLNWQANPENISEIVNYKLYRKPKSGGSLTLIQTLAPTVFSYEERGLKAEELFTYQLTAVNSRGKESDPVTFGN